MNIISFNVGTTHLMHYNKRTNYPLGEIEKDKIKRSKILKLKILSSVNKVKADFLCIQEGFDDVFPITNKFSHLTEISKYEVVHGIIGGFKSSYLATYADLKKYDIEEDTLYNEKYQSINFNKKTRIGYPCRTQIYKITIKKTNEKFVLVNFHGIGDPDTEIREKFLLFLSKYLTDVYSKDDVILVGDINTNLQKGSIEIGETKKEKEEIGFCNHVMKDIFKDFDIFPEDETKKSSYHRFIKNPDNTFIDKPKKNRYDCLDYCLVKKHMGKDVKVERLPKGFKNMQVPYILNKQNIIKPNFDIFPSDHTLNIYTFKKRDGFFIPGKLRIPIKQPKKSKSVGYNRNNGSKKGRGRKRVVRGKNSKKKRFGSV
jgi:hypothetical protein